MCLPDAVGVFLLARLEAARELGLDALEERVVREQRDLDGVQLHEARD